ncbi:MAG: tetratricopeptide repeat protein [Butyricicoccus sp.]|nr:tetratricopeptide repeat protein [Butyricicoccus sp.]
MWDTLDGFYKKLYDIQNDREQTERFLNQSAAWAKGAEEQIAVYNELGSFYRSIGSYAQSLAAFERAQVCAASQFGKTCNQYAAILNNMAGTYRRMGDYERAVAGFEQAMAIYRALGEKQTDAYASVLNNLSLTYRELGRLDEAILSLERALLCIEKMPGSRQEIAVTYNNLATLYHAAGKREQAMACLGRAVQEFEKCAEEENVPYAEGMNSLAALLYAEGNFTEALALYRKSAAYTKRFCGENVEYALTLQNMAWIYQQLGQAEEAHAALTRAGKIYQNRLGPDHERTRAVADTLKRMRLARR